MPIVLVPRTVPLLLVAPPASTSVTVAELLKLEVELLIIRALAGRGVSARIPNARDTFWFSFLNANFVSFLPINLYMPSSGKPHTVCIADVGNAKEFIPLSPSGY